MDDLGVKPNSPVDVQVTIILVDGTPALIHNSMDNLCNLIHKGHHL